jgi:hypothetical protein
MKKLFHQSLGLARHCCFRFGHVFCHVTYDFSNVNSETKIEIGMPTSHEGTEMFIEPPIIATRKHVNNYSCLACFLVFRFFTHNNHQQFQ